MSEIGILSIHTYLPDGKVNVMDLASRLGVDEKFIREKTGFTSLLRRAAHEDTSHLAEGALRIALAEHPELTHHLGLLIVVTQTPDGYGLPHVSAIVHGRLDLPETVAAFDLSLGCSGWVYGLSVAKSFMESNDIAYGILVTADPYSKLIDAADRNTSLLFGDAATATVLSRVPIWRIGRFVFGTAGRQVEDLMVRNDGKLAMNGRAILNFSATKVPECVRAALAVNGLALDSVERIVLHQASRYIVDTIGTRVGAPEKTEFTAAETGNTVSSSIPLTIAELPQAKRGKMVVCGFGVGLSWAATVLSSENENVEPKSNGVHHGS
jgi:3-oxoacyl-[acyl-carrier-protein] synthase-3